MTLLPPHTDSASLRLANVAGELARVVDRITDAALVARGLADAVHWQAKAATAFHERATSWAGDVSGLACLAESARCDVARAQDRAIFAESFPGLFAGAQR